MRLNIYYKIKMKYIIILISSLPGGWQHYRAGLLSVYHQQTIHRPYSCQRVHRFNINDVSFRRVSINLLIIKSSKLLIEYEVISDAPDRGFPKINTLHLPNKLAGMWGVPTLGPFKKYVTVKIPIFDPFSPPCHRLSPFALTPLVTTQIVTNFFTRN